MTSAIQLTRNDYAEFLLSAVSTTDGVTPVPLNNCTLAVFSVKQKVGAGLVLQCDSTDSSPNSRTTINVSAGTVSVYLSSTDTATLLAGEYRYDCQLTIDGKLYTLVNDWLTVIDDVTIQGLLPDVLQFSDITVAHVKQYLGLSLTDYSKDAQIALTMPQVEKYICEYCNHDFEQTSRTEVPRITNSYQKSFFLSHRPIPDGYGTTIVEDGTTLTEGTDFYVHKDLGEVERLSSYLPYFGFGSTDSTNIGSQWNPIPGKISVTYTGGEILSHDVLQVYYELVAIRCQLKTRTFIDNDGLQQAVTMTSLPTDLLKWLDNHVHTRV